MNTVYAWLVVNGFIDSEKFRQIFAWLVQAAKNQGCMLEIKTNDMLLPELVMGEKHLLQGQRLDQAGIEYHFFYLVGISGAGNGKKGAKQTATLCNELHPKRIGANMLTIYPDSRLYAEIQAGNWKESILKTRA